MVSNKSVTMPEGTGLGKAFTTLRSPEQKNRYVITGFLLSVFGIFVASIPLGAATLVIGRVLLRNRIKAWGYFFCVIGTAWAVLLPIINFFHLIKTESITIIPPVAQFFQSLKALLFK
jgi:hypothetical protein